MAITEVFIQITDVPLSLRKQQEARWPQIRIPRATWAQGAAVGMERQGHGAHPSPGRHLPLPSSATAEPRETRKRRKKETGVSVGGKDRK